MVKFYLDTSSTKAMLFLDDPRVLSYDLLVLLTVLCYDWLAYQSILFRLDGCYKSRLINADVVQIQVDNV